MYKLYITYFLISFPLFVLCQVNDKNLQRLLAFRLRIDGEAALSEYLIRKIREIIRCAYSGSLYDFIKDDDIEKECGVVEGDPEPPGAA